MSGVRDGGPRGLRLELCQVAHALHQRGWVANHDGNVTARLGPDRFLATPTATSKRLIDQRGLIEVDGKGQRVAGTARGFGELGMHLAVYGARDDVGAVVHAHPPHATALAVSGSPLLERPFIAEAVVSLGARVPTVPYAAPGATAVTALAGFVAEFDAVLLGNHGAMAWGADLEQALLRLELVEHLARVALLSQASGGPRYLADDQVAPLLEKRARAGLGKAAERAAGAGRPGGEGSAAGSGGRASRGPRPVVACAPAPHSETPTIAPGGGSGAGGAGGAGAGRTPAAGRAEIAALVREELVRALKGR